jgi:hypothetical protein
LNSYSFPVKLYSFGELEQARGRLNGQDEILMNSMFTLSRKAGKVFLITQQFKNKINSDLCYHIETQVKSISR